MEEKPGASSLVDLHREHVLAVESHGTLGDRVLRVARDRVSQRRLAGAVRAHDGVGLARLDREIDAPEDLARLLASGGVHHNMQVTNF